MSNSRYILSLIYRDVLGDDSVNNISDMAHKHEDLSLGPQNPQKRARYGSMPVTPAAVCLDG